MFRELRNIVKDQLVRVSQLVKLLLLGVWWDCAHYLGVSVFEIWVSSKLLSLLWVLK